MSNSPGKTIVNGKAHPRLWSVSMTIEFPASVGSGLLHRIAEVEKRIDRVHVASSPGRVGAVVLALEQLADIVSPSTSNPPRRKGRRR